MSKEVSQAVARRKSDPKKSCGLLLGPKVPRGSLVGGKQPRIFEKKAVDRDQSMSRLPVHYRLGSGQLIIFHLWRIGGPSATL